MTGVPAWSDSSGVMPKGSETEGIIKRSAAR
jgi:hypothetical protein